MVRRVGGGFAPWRDAAAPPMAWGSRELASTACSRHNYSSGSAEPEPAPNTARYTVTDRLQLILYMPQLSITRMKSGPSAVWTTCHPKASGVTLWRSMSSFVSLAVTVAILRVHDCPREHLATMVDGRPAPTAARGPQGSHKPHHNSRERALRGERSGGNRDESRRRAICQIAGLDDAVPFVDARLTDGSRAHAVLGCSASRPASNCAYPQSGPFRSRTALPQAR